MSGIKLHLDQGESDAVARFAAALGVRPEDVAFAALNRLMTKTEDPELRRDVVETRDWRKHNLPMWSDSACSVHAYEGKPDDQPAPGHKG